MAHESDRLIVSEDDKVRVIRDRMRAAQTRVETALSYVLWSEVRVELRGVQSVLAEALALIGR